MIRGSNLQPFRNSSRDIRSFCQKQDRQLASLRSKTTRFSAHGIKFSENLVHPHLCCCLVLWEFNVPSDSSINRFDNPRHFLLSDISVPIHIVKLECKLQPLIGPSSARNVQAKEVFSEIQEVVFICIENSEKVLGKGYGVAKGEIRAVNLVEF